MHEVLDRVIGAVMAKAQPARIGAGGPAHDLVTETDAQQRPAVGDGRSSQGHRPVQSCRITGSGREDQAVQVGGESQFGGRVVGQDAHACAARGEMTNDVLLEPQIDDGDERSAGRADFVRLDDRYAADEILVLPARDGGSIRGGHVSVGRAGCADPRALRTRLPQVPRQRPSVYAGDRRHPGVAQKCNQLLGRLQDGGRGVTDNEPGQPRPDRLVVALQPAVVADQRIGHDNDLAGVRRVGADLLVAGLRGVHHQVAATARGRAKTDAAYDRAIGQREQRRPVAPDPRVDYRIRG